MIDRLYSEYSPGRSELYPAAEKKTDLTCFFIALAWSAQTGRGVSGAAPFSRSVPGSPRYEFSLNKRPRVQQ